MKGGNTVSTIENVKYRKSNKPAVLTKKERKAQGIGKDEGRATLMFARISSTKVRTVINLIRGKNVNEAMAILKFTPKAASTILAKLLKSAMANAENNNNMDVDKLYVSEAYANQGPTLKRIQPKAKGSAGRILKRSSHITLVVKERE
jgi:large subunit ribosomal protein L22